MSDYIPTLAAKGSHIKPADVLEAFAEARSRYPHIEMAMADGFAHNFRNVSIELVDVLSKTDGDIFGEIAAPVYLRPPKEKVEMGGFYDASPLDLTPYGLVVIKARFFTGWIGNLAQGDLLDAEQAASMAMAYEAYWAAGGDYLLGCVVEAPIKRLGDPRDWKMKSSRARGHKLATDIAMAIRDLYVYHRDNQPNSVARAFGRVPSKPDFIDFKPRVEAVSKRQKKADGVA